MIAVLDYGAGNVGSVLKAVQYLGYSAERVDRPELLSRAPKVIFPGQGHFGSMMTALRERCFLGALREILQSGIPFLGICLGFQALYEASDEAPESPGLGIFSGRVERLTGIFKVPMWDGASLRLNNRRACSTALRPAASSITATHITAPPPLKAQPLRSMGSDSSQRQKPEISLRCSFIRKSRAMWD